MKPATVRPRRKLRSLLQWRESRGWRQVDACRYLGVTQSLYNRYELHIVHPSPMRAKVLSAKTGLPLDVVLGIAD